MFHVLKFIDSNTDLNLEEKISYIKNFRVQLNTFEQALLIVNSKTIFGKDWSKYIIKYNDFIFPNWGFYRNKCY